MHQGRRRDEAVYHRQRPAPIFGLAREGAPTRRGPGINREQPLPEPRDEIAPDPRLKPVSARRSGQPRDPLLELAYRQYAQVEQRLILRFDPFQNRSLRAFPCVRGQTPKSSLRQRLGV